MPRAPFQILLIPFIRQPEGILYAIFRRRDDGRWQGIAGGGEEGETPETAALREGAEEGGITMIERLIRLETTAEIPVIHFRDRAGWGERETIPEYAFGGEVGDRRLLLSHEHTEALWCDGEEAIDRLYYQSNRDAVRELERELKRIKS